MKKFKSSNKIIYTWNENGSFDEHKIYEMARWYVGFHILSWESAAWVFAYWHNFNSPKSSLLLPTIVEQVKYGSINYSGWWLGPKRIMYNVCICIRCFMYISLFSRLVSRISRRPKSWNLCECKSASIKEKPNSSTSNQHVCLDEKHD